MKKPLLVLILSMTTVAASGCVWGEYKDEKVNIYREKNVVDKQITLRFYKKYSHVPYIEPNAYYQEFFNDSFVVQKNDNGTKYSLASGDFLYFDVKNNRISCTNLSILSNHKDFVSSKSKIFLQTESIDETERSVKTISLDKYHIRLYRTKGEVYAPLTLLSKYFGGINLYNIAYNGKDIYVLDVGPSLSDVERDTAYYGSKYNSKLNNFIWSRPKDLREYSYNELCFVFDNFRGYTSQMVFGDEAFRSLGLDGLLESYYPELKQDLLSSRRMKYYGALYTLFNGLADGGHTGLMTANWALIGGAIIHSETAPYAAVNAFADNINDNMVTTQLSCLEARAEKFENPWEFYYIFDENSQTAYIGFDEFAVDYAGWDNYYKGLADEPIDTDTYAFVRHMFYQAKEDGAKNIVLDLSTNGGGDTYAYAGLIGLVNHARSDIKMYDVFNDYIITENYIIDINLDGVIDELDALEAEQFDFNIGVLTSRASFSCANLFPMKMKELGYKIIGERSGGGSCAISVESTAEGISYVRSSHLCLYNAENKIFDDGVPVDFEIESPMNEEVGKPDYSNFYNIELVSSFFAS